MSNKIKFNTQKFFYIIIDINNKKEKIIQGQDLEVVCKPELKIYIKKKFINEEILFIKKNKIYVRTLTANKIPIYSRIINSKLILSNCAHLLIARNENINLSSFVLFQQLRGIDFPQKNFFLDIKLLDSSSLYEIKKNKLVFKNNTFIINKKHYFVKSKDILLRNCEKIFEKGNPIALLISGGYDSRLNLAIAKYFSKKYSNKITCYHEYKNKSEMKIVKKLISLSKLKLVVKSRSFFNKEKDLIYNKKFILSNNGTYRQNLIRWHGYLDYILDKNKNTIIFGLGAEAHKGKYYKQIKNIYRDCEKNFGISYLVIRMFAKYLKIKSFDIKSQKKFFSILFRRCKNYKNLYTKIDYLHYHTYVSNGYGQRCYYLIREFDMHFPFLEKNFLESIFSLNSKDKIDFKFVRDMIGCLDPQLNSVPFLSGNIKSTKTLNFKNTVRNYIKSKIDLIRPYFYPFWKLRQISQHVKLTNKEKLIIKKFYNEKSQITKELYKILINDGKTTPGIRMEVALQLFLYFSTLEKEKNVNFILN